MPSLDPSPSEIHQYVESWLEKVSPDQVPYTEEAIADNSQPPTKVVFKIGGDSESDEKSECQTHPDEYYLPPASVGHCLEATALLHDDRLERGLCVSMPSVRVDPVQPEDRLRPNKSAEAIDPAENGSHPSTSNCLMPRASTTHVLHELYSSIHCITSACEDNRTSNLEKSNSLPNISTQVASALGSSCKAFMSFLSVMTLRDNLTGPALGDDNQSEALLMMESLQKMSAIEDEEELRASLTDLQSRASFRFREHWNDFQILRERLESEPLSPKFSETEFALDVVSEGGDAFEDIEELMDELNMPQDLRAEISSTVQQAKLVYPAEESTFVETERNQSDSEDDLEQFVEESNNETKQSLESDTASIAEDITQTQQRYDNGEIDPLETMQSVYSKSENDEEEEEQGEEVRDVGNDREDGLTKETDDERGEGEEGAVTVKDDTGGKVSVEKEDQEAEEVLMEEVQEEGEDCSVEETDEREGDEKTAEEEADEWGKGEAEESQGDRIEEGTVEVIEESDDEEEEADEFIGETDGEERVASEDNNEEEEESEQEVVEDGEDINIEDEENEGEETDNNMEEEEKCDEGEESRKEPQETVHSLEEESAGEKEVEEEIEESIKTGQMLDDKQREDDSENESDELNEGIDELEEQESKGELEEEHASEDADSIAASPDCKHLLEEASYLQQQSSCDETKAKVAEPNTGSPTTYSTECQCEDDKGNGTDTVNEFERDDGGKPREDGRDILQHPVEISQELLDFVNSALQSSSLIFTYDARGNVRIEPDSARVTHNKQYVIPKSGNDTSYGLKCLPSPSNSGLSDYRPETSESGGYKTQESVDIVTDSGEEASPVCGGKTDIPFRKCGTNVEGTDSKPPDAIITDVLRKNTGGSFSSYDSGTKASKEDLSYFSAASSQKADTEPATQCISSPTEKDSADGVLIDQGRWLLKENHLIRKSPPVSQGMYGDLDCTSLDTGQENNSEDSPSHCNTQHQLLADISSSELEEMAKPQTPKCTYYNMPHGSDSDPFLDDSSVKSGKRDASSIRGRGFRVSPTINTSKTWINKNGSLSSFESVQFKIQDRKVHPEGESSPVTRARRTPGGERGVVQVEDTCDALRVRCSQFCPIL
ncbi:Oxygen-regulated protein 1 [Liparis tanakae]|uniref:Oxygen-regulated protein 1 n=1 Tax=Liparis tanakae TaxID=230148 RepID=A0A4Z2IL90_9TELE|nr:Oxygen-regulated protein 1 [Liparis tanakae]